MDCQRQRPTDDRLHNKAARAPEMCHASLLRGECRWFGRVMRATESLANTILQGMEEGAGKEEEEGLVPKRQRIDDFNKRLDWPSAKGSGKTPEWWQEEIEAFH